MLSKPKTPLRIAAARKQVRVYRAILLACLIVPQMAFADAKAFVRLFDQACLASVPDFSSAANAAKAEGMQLQKDGTFKGNDLLLNPAMKLSSSKNKACLVMGPIDDRQALAKAIISSLKARRIAVKKATVKGKKIEISAIAGGKVTEIRVAPIARTLTSATVFQP